MLVPWWNIRILKWHTSEKMTKRLAIVLVRIILCVMLPAVAGANGFRILGGSLPVGMVVVVLIDETKLLAAGYALRSVVKCQPCL